MSSRESNSALIKCPNTELTTSAIFLNRSERSIFLIPAKSRPHKKQDSERFGKNADVVSHDQNPAFSYMLR